MKQALFLLVLFLGTEVYSQGDTAIVGSPEERFSRIRALGQAGEGQDVIVLSRELLGEFPGYGDVAIYLSLLYGHKSEYDSAFLYLNPVLEKDPLNEEAILAKTSILYWAGRWEELESETDSALKILPGNPDLLYRRAVALHELGRDGSSLEVLNELLLAVPGNEPARSLRSQLMRQQESKEIFGRYLLDYFRNPYLRRWNMVSAGAELPFSKGSFIPYLNAGHFISDSLGFIESSAIQLNADVYLDLTPRNYMLLGYGIGTGTYLPVHRGIVSIWQTLPSAWAISAGARYFYFDRHYFFYAVGAEKYLGNYWFELNNYIFNKEYGISIASYLTIRRYLENRFNYLSLTLGYGTSPDEPITSVVDLQRLKAVSARLSLMKQISDRLKLGTGLSWQLEEYLEQNYRNRAIFQVSLHYKLN